MFNHKAIIYLLVSFIYMMKTAESLQATTPVAALKVQPQVKPLTSVPSKADEVPGSNAVHQNKTLASRTIPNLLNLATHVQVDICIDLSITLSGTRVVNVAAVAALGLSIESSGITVDQLAIIQANVASTLQAKSRTATTAWACEHSCTSDICRTHSFDNDSHACTLTPKQLTPTSSLIANLIAELSLLGSRSSDYCSLCPNRCTSTPTSLGRYSKRNQITLGFCPMGLDACPISHDYLSEGYECINVKEELTSCGGCVSTGEGVNCNTIPGIKVAGCSAGKCIALACQEGFALVEDKLCHRTNV